MKQKVNENNRMQVGLLNVDGYYDLLLSFIDKAVEEGFVAPLPATLLRLPKLPMTSCPTSRYYY